MTDMIVIYYKSDELLDLISHYHGDIDELLEVALYNEHCPGACGHCGAVHDHVDVDDKDVYCEECGENALRSVCVLAGVV